MAGVTWAKAWFTKGRVCGSLKYEQPGAFHDPISGSVGLLVMPLLANALLNQERRDQFPAPPNSQKITGKHH